jgi:hypothetical protein
LAKPRVHRLGERQRAKSHQAQATARLPRAFVIDVDTQPRPKMGRKPMISRHERIRNAVQDALTRSNVDTRNLAIELVDGFLVVEGTVPSMDEREQVVLLLRECLEQGVSAKCDVSVMDVPPSDSPDGRGRSTVTGTSADSARESRHQLDRT